MSQGFKRRSKDGTKGLQLLQILNDLSIRHLIKLILYENDVKPLEFKRSPV